MRGLEAIARFFDGLRPHMADDRQVAVDELIAAGDRVVALVHRCGTAPGGRPYDVPSIMVWTVSDGRLSAMYEQLDTLAMGRATEGAPAAV